MTWITFLFLGLAIGWALEFLIDMWFWGRRNRHLEALLSTCRSEIQASEQKLNEALETVAHYQKKEKELKQCQFDLTDLTGRHERLGAQTEDLSLELESSQKLVGQLGQRSSELQGQRDQLHDTLEDVNRWVESSMRRRVWNTFSWKNGLNRSKGKSVAYARSIAATATSKMNQAVGKYSGSLSNAKAQMIRSIDQSRPVRWSKTSYCRVWRLIDTIFNRSKRPSSCTYNSN